MKNPLEYIELILKILSVYYSIRKIENTFLKEKPTESSLKEAFKKFKAKIDKKLFLNSHHTQTKYNTKEIKMQNVEIKCINKSDRDNTHEHIKNIDGISNDAPWKITQQEETQYSEAKQMGFYVKKGDNKVQVAVEISRYGNKYIKTEANGEMPNNPLSRLFLLSLKAKKLFTFIKDIFL